MVYTNWQYEKQQLKKELKRQLDWRRVLFKGLLSIRIPAGIAKKLAGVSAWEAHQEVERKKMTRELWLHVMRCYNWTCVKTGIQNRYNREPGKPKLQADHIKSVGYWGETYWMQLQPLVDYENKSKNMKQVDYRTPAQKMMQLEYGKKHGLL
jgi:hypothetical protein